jgi:hypothetical protein
MGEGAELGFGDHRVAGRGLRPDEIGAARAFDAQGGFILAMASLALRGRSHCRRRDG